MPRIQSARTSRSTTRALLARGVPWTVAAALALSGVAVAQTPGPNRNVVSGVVHPLNPHDPTIVIQTDILRQRQNEPVMAPSSLNAEHLLAAANDYRTIDIALDMGTGERSDGLLARALARAVSFFQRLLGMKPELPHRPTAAADAWMGVYRSCNRGQNWIGSLLPGSPTDSSSASLASPLRGLEAASDPVLAPGPEGRAFLGGLAYTRGATSAIFVARYTDRNDREGGACFNYDFTRVVEAGTVSDTGRFADKPTIAADVTRTKGGNTKRFAYMAYTIFTGVETDSNFRGRVRFVRSEDDGLTWSTPVTLSGSYIHNQGAALAIDPVNGDVYIVWRDFIDHRILMTRSHDFGARWSDPVPIHAGLLAAFDQVTGPDQFRSNGFPTIAIDGTSRVFVAWQERVNAAGAPDSAGSPRIVLTMSSSITNQGVTWTPRRAVDLGSGPQVMPALSASAGQLMLVFAEAVGATLIGRDVRLDVRVAELDPATGALFLGRSSVPVSEYDFQADDSVPPRLVETATGFPAVHRPNLPMFRGGTVPFIGDYKFLAASQPFVRTPAGEWRWASSPGDLANPSFHAIWTDNRNVQFPQGDIHGPWDAYAPPGTGAPSCINAGSRNQDVFTSEISNGIVAGTPSLFKPLLRPNGEPIPRAFVVYVENRTPEERQLILNLVPEPNTGTTASFDQFDSSRTTLPPAGDENSSMVILPYSTLTRAVYVESTTRNARVDFEVRDAVSSVLLARVVLNESPSAFPLTNTSISDSEIHTPRISNPRISNPRISNPRISNPRISNWTVSNPRISNPRISNPRISNLPPEGEGGETRDVTYTMINTGNTTTVYDVQTFIPEEYVQSDKYAFQLIVFRTVSSVGADLEAGLCPVEVLRDEFISSVESPRISNPRISNTGPQSPRISNPRISNTSFYLEPAEGPLGTGGGGSGAASSLSAATSASLSGSDTRVASFEDLALAAQAASSDTGDLSAPLPVPQVHITLRVYQLGELEAGDPTLEDLISEDPTQPTLISAAIVSQATNVIEGVPDEDPPYVLVGPQPPVPEKEADGELVPVSNPPPSAAGLAFSQQPRSTQLGQVITPPVEVRIVDPTGATVPLTGVAVTLSLPSSPGALAGALTQLSDSGFVRFSDLSIGVAGSGHTLLASAPGLASATSAPFDITVDPPVVPPLTARASVDSAESQGTGPGEGCAGGRSITPDGRYVAFDCTFTNLVTADANNVRDVFVRDVQAGTTVRASVTSLGSAGNGASSFGSLSDDGRFVAFQSSATNLVAGDTNGADDIFVRDLPAGTTTRVSLGLASQANGASSLPVISGNGRFVAFWSRATNLVAGDTNGQTDVFVFDRVALSTVRVSVQTGGAQSTQTEGTLLHAAPAISSDGRLVAFQSARSNLAPQGVAGVRDIYVHDRQSLVTTRVSRASSGSQGALPSGCGPWDGPFGKIPCAAFASSNPSLSADGRFVAFDSLYSNLVAGDTNYTGAQLGRDVFVHDRQTGGTTRVSVASGGTQDNTSSAKGAPCGVGPSTPMLSPDARFVAFSSCGSSLVAGDANGISDAFLHDRLLGTTIRTSVVSGGAEATTALAAFGTRFVAASTGARLLTMSSDAETMVPGDTNRNVAAGQLGTDIFVHEPVPAPAPAGSRALAFVVPPTPTPADGVFSPAIEVALQDGFGNTDRTAADLVTLSVDSGPSMLQGTRTVSAIAGVAAFPGVFLAVPGTYAIRAQVAGVPDVVSATFVVGPAVPVKLGFVTQPTDIVATAVISPAVRVAVQSARGSTIPGRTDTITLATAGGVGVLSGTTSAVAVDGVATFANLSVDVVATGYSLVATAPSLASGTSSPFDVLTSATPLAIEVTNTNDSGRGSLRQALLAANANTGSRDSVTFGIPGAGLHIITPVTALPAVADPIVLDATTQPGYGGVPLVRLDGGGLASGDGLTIQASASTVRGLMVTAFPGRGIVLGGASDSTIEGNYVGTDGTASLGNGSDGVLVSGGADNAVRNNVVSANHAAGIDLLTTQRATIVANLVGTSASGSGVMGNWQGGVLVQGDSHDNTIGLGGQGNVICGSLNTGVRLIDAFNNVVRGNRIGTNGADAAGFGNQLQGLSIHGAFSTGNVIGGLGVGDGNVVAGNVTGGILLGADTHHNTIEGNRIGTNGSGNASLANRLFGLLLNTGATSNTVRGNQLSGNEGPGLMFSADTVGSVVENNLIGTNAAGDAALANTASGVVVMGVTAHDHTLRGNVVSGNLGAGIELLGGAYGITIAGNKLGMNAAGMGAIGNAQGGVLLQTGAHDNTIGLPSEGNVISGNGNSGLRLIDSSNNVVRGNWIGTDAIDAPIFGNQLQGLQVHGTSTGNIIGGPGPADGNVVSGNAYGGIMITGPVRNTTIERNRVGITASGSSLLPNGSFGLYLVAGGLGGGHVVRGNVFSGNAGPGLWISFDVRDTIVEDNFIGTNALGDADMGNAASGIRIEGVTTAGHTLRGNIVSGNLGSGVEILSGASATLQGNRIGTSADGMTDIGNTNAGVLLYSSGGSVIGGPSAGQGNVISGNDGPGVSIVSGSGNLVSGNWIGTNGARESLGNGGNGVSISGSSLANILGGLADGSGNTIAFNTGNGIQDVAGPSGTQILGNSIFSNGLLGIFGNGFQNSPVLASAATSGGTTTVSGSLSQLSSPNAFFRIEFFRSSNCDTSGSGEGDRLMGRAEVTTDGSGNAAFSVPFAAISGGVVTATATSSSIGTSGFSACLVPDLASVVGDLRTIALAELAYQGSAFGLYGTLDCLATPSNCISGYAGPAFISGDLASLAPMAGYVRAFSPGPAVPSPLLVPGLQEWAYTAVPASGFGPGFCIEGTSGIFVNDDGTATAVNGRCTSGTPWP